MAQNFGRLERVDLRTIWPHEAADFTPWLAENLHFLSEAIKIDLELDDQEKNIGLFRADILAKDINTGDWVLIENQLECTDHGHLGQLITYAAGLKAVTIVWIAAQFTDEHIAALDWLNSIIDDTIQIFGIQIETYRVGGVIAPKLTIVSKPNSWLKRTTVKKYKRVSDEEILAFRTANPDKTVKDVAAHFGISERKVYSAKANQTADIGAVIG